MTTFRPIDSQPRDASLSDQPPRRGATQCLPPRARRRGGRPHRGRGRVVAASLERWSELYRPANALDELPRSSRRRRLSVRLRRCWKHDWALRMLAAERADTRWDEDRRLAAEELGARLATNPALIGRRLRRTLQGCQWLRERSEALAALLRAGHDWDEAGRGLALDLLGTPSALREGPTRLDPPGSEGEALREARLALAESELAALDRLRDESLAGLDESGRLSATLGFAPSSTGIRGC